MAAEFRSKYASGVMRPSINEARERDNEQMTATRFIFTRCFRRSPAFLLVWIVMPFLLVLGSRSLLRSTPRIAPLLAGRDRRAAGRLRGAPHQGCLPVLLVSHLFSARRHRPRRRRPGPVDRKWRGKKHGRSWQGAAILVSFFALFAGANSFGAHRFIWLPGKVGAPQEFVRGKLRWITYPDGKTRREPMQAGAALRSETP